MCIEAVQQKVLHRAFLGEDVDTHSRQGVEYQVRAISWFGADLGAELGCKLTVASLPINIS